MINAPKISEIMAKKLEEMILNGVFKAGDRLPPERQLAEKFEVSRPSIREAIQILKAKQLLTSRQGGGNYVNQELGSGMLDPLFSLFEENPKAHEDLLEFRYTLEGECAYLAATRATEPDLRNLSKCFDDLMVVYRRNDPAAEAAADARFYLAIAEASHNVVFLHTIKSLFDLLKRNVVTNIGGLFAEGFARESLKNQHQEIFLAIKSRNPELAKEKAQAHLAYVRESLFKLEQENARREAARLKEELVS